MTDIVAARLRCTGISLYCGVLAVVGIVAIVLMVIGKLLVAFGDLWHAESKATEGRLDVARALLAKLKEER